MDELTSFAARNGFLPHGFCFQWTPSLLWGMVTADVAIAAAYFSIPLAIFKAIRRRPEINLHGLAWLFGAFIFSCGLTHVMDVWTIWRPDYDVQTVSKLVTALISVVTAAMVWRVMPVALALPSAQALQRAVSALQTEVDRRISAEDSLMEVEQSLAATLSSIEAGFITADAQGRIKRLNAVAEHMTQWTCNQAQGLSLWEVVQREGRPADYISRNPIDVLQELSASGSLCKSVICLGRLGARTPVNLHAELTRHKDGTVIGITIVLRDMARLTSAQAEIRRLASVVESSSDAIVVKDLTGRITDWNPAAQAMFGYSAAEMVGQSILKLVPQSLVSEEQHVLECLKQGQPIPPFRTWRLTQSGNLVEVSVQVSPLRDIGGQIIGGIKAARDMTHQRHVEEALRQSESRLRLAMEAANLGDWDMDTSTQRIQRSERYDRCFGPTELPAIWTRSDMLARVHEEDRENIDSALALCADAGHSCETQFRVRWPDGSVHWLRMDARLITHLHDGSHLVGIVQDITVAKQAEFAREKTAWLEAENKRVQESSRLKSLFLANMSHELRTPLNAVIGFSDILQQGLVKPDSPKHAQYLTYISSSGRHLLQMINDVLDLSKIEAGKLTFHPVATRLQALVDDVVQTLSVQARDQRLDVRVHVDAPLCEIWIDPTRLKQVLFNFLSNAVKFTGTGGRIDIRATTEGPHWWRLEVEDTGCGIPQEQLSRLFVEFQQLDAGLNKKHQGTGLGLALTRRLVEAQLGRVGVRSQLGQGSCFYAVLPRQHGKHDKLEANTARVLLAWHDPQVRDSLSRAMAMAGIPHDQTGAVNRIDSMGQERPYDALALDLSQANAPGLLALSNMRSGSGASAQAAVKAIGYSCDKGVAIAFPVTDVLFKPLQRDAALSRALDSLHSEQRRQSTTVLVVDDDPAACEIMQVALREVGLITVSVQHGQHILDTLDQVRPMAMVLDLMMPEVSGFQVLESIRQSSQWSGLPVIVWTAMALSKDEQLLLGQSAQAIASKGEQDTIGIVRDALLQWFLAYAEKPTRPEGT